MNDVEDRLAKLEAAVFAPKLERKLISLEEHQRNYLERYREANNDKPRRNGVACPECGAELYDSSPLTRHLSSPPSLSIHCEECKFKGSRFG